MHLELSTSICEYLILQIEKEKTIPSVVVLAILVYITNHYNSSSV